MIGFTPGDDRKLASWAQIVDYFKKLQRASDRVKLQELGKTTLGRPFVLATISSPANLARLDRFREIQHKLADPRTINGNDGEAEKLIAEGRTIVMITCGIHSTEVGGNLVSMNLAHRLASDHSPETREILDRFIILLVPSLNPDGLDIVKNWYDKTLGTPAEGTSPPELYHHYAGHDNNRDWYAFTQVETQLTIDKIQSVWHPQIVHDIHQQGDTGSRFFLPPYVEPWEPNVPPIIQAGVNFMGSSMAWELIAEGKAGVVTNGVYDAWTPARAYQHYHGGIRILSETASGRIASPTNIPFEKLTPQVFDQYKDAPLLKLSYTSVTDFDIRAGNLELKLVAKGTQIPYPTKEQAEAAAKSTPPGGDPYTAQGETAYYRERPGTGGSRQEGWVVVGKNPVVTGLDIREASAKPSEWARAEYQIDFSLTPDGTRRRSDATGKHVGDRLAIVLNNQVKTAPLIHDQINDPGQLTGDFTKQAAEDLARTLGISVRGLTA